MKNIWSMSYFERIILSQARNNSSEQLLQGYLWPWLLLMQLSSHNALFSNSLAAVHQRIEPLNPSGHTARYLITAAAHLRGDDAAKAAPIKVKESRSGPTAPELTRKTHSADLLCKDSSLHAWSPNPTCCATDPQWLWSALGLDIRVLPSLILQLLIVVVAMKRCF